MKYLKQLLIYFVLGILLFVLFYGFTEGFSALFVFPILFLAAYVGYYLYKQMEKDDEARMDRGIKLTVEDAEASKWIKQTFAPDTLSVIKRKRWTVILYSFLIVGMCAFAWSYLSFGLLIAVRNFSYGAFLFWLFIAYVLFAPAGFDYIIKRFFSGFLRSLVRARDDKIKMGDKRRGIAAYVGDWERAYLFLLPISFVVYLLYPFGDSWRQILSKFLSFPVFFVIYTFLFLALYSLIYMYEDMEKDEVKRMEREIKRVLSKQEKES